MEFVQIIELQTSRFDEVLQAHEAWLAETDGVRTSLSELVVKDRDRTDTYLVIVRFPSYEAAMANNDLPATQKFSESISGLLDAPPTFLNTDVVRMDA